MMSGSKRFVENLKTVILVVLFIATILLLYLLWSGENSGKIAISEFLPFSGSKKSTLQYEEVLVPASIAWGEGDGSFRYRTVDLQDSQEYFIEQLRELYQGTVLVYSITENQFYQAVKENKSSVLQLGIDIPYEDFCRANDISIAGGEGIAYVESLAISEAANDSMIIFDGLNKLYYRLAVEGAEIRPYEEDAPNGENANADTMGIYYPADIVLGSSNDALLPIVETSNLSDCRYEPESENAMEELGVSMAEAVFGDTFDFVRRITDDFGTVTYMYGYGQKTLTVNNDGSFAYKAETSGESGGFYEDLQTALDFVASCGGWENDGIEAINYRLAEVSSSGSGKGISYVFSFAACIKGYQVHSETGYPIVVGISNGQVSDYYRNTYSLRAFAEGENVTVSDAANVIASNAGHMYKVMNNDALSPNTDEAFAYVANIIVSMKMGYYKYDSGNSIVPCWIVTMDDGTRFFFDLYEGVPLGFVR